MTTLQLLRKVRGATQRQLARQLGICVTDLSKLENRWFTKVPEHVERKLKKLFGQDWTFETLMQEVVLPTPPSLTESRGDSRADELRKAS